MIRLILGVKLDHDDSYRTQHPLYRLAAVCGKKDVIIHQVDTMLTTHLTGGDISQEISVDLNSFVERIKLSNGGTDFCIVNGLEVGITPPNPPYATYQMKLCPEMDQETVKAVSNYLISQGFHLVQSGYTRHGAQYDYFKENPNH